MRIAELKRLDNSVFCFSPFAISLGGCPKSWAGTGACPYGEVAISHFRIPKSTNGIDTVPSFEV
jgi:hypothetical protein